LQIDEYLLIDDGKNGAANFRGSRRAN